MQYVIVCFLKLSITKREFMRERKCVLLFVYNASLLTNLDELLMVEDEATFMR
jgi:hypothetical protein